MASKWRKKAYYGIINSRNTRTRGKVGRKNVLIMQEKSIKFYFFEKKHLPYRQIGCTM